MLFAQQDLFWVGGSGDWTDMNHWSKQSAGIGVVPAGTIPSSNDHVIIDSHSGLSSGTILTMPAGSHEVLSIEVTTLAAFTWLFDGSSAASTTLTVYADLDLKANMNLVFSGTNISHNVIHFDGSGQHNIRTGGNDLYHVEFLDVNGVYTQFSDLTATGQIRMYGGTWNTDGFDVNSYRLLFKDDNSSSSPITKVLNTGGSTLTTDNWDSGFTYGSLTVNGSHTIRTARFLGSPKQVNGPAFSYDNVYLLEYSDTPTSTSIVEHNNFECRSCIIENIRIEDTGETKFADKFTVNKDFEVTNLGSTILFNGGNNRTSEVTFNGDVLTPSVSGCTGRTNFSAVHTNSSTFVRASGSVVFKDVIINDIIASGGATFKLSNGVLQGLSSGWTITNPPTSVDYYWKGVTGANRSWDDPGNWVLSNGSSNGCIPSISDNVFVNSSAKGNIRIPSSYVAECANFTWTNTNGYRLILDGTSTLSSELKVAGDFYVDQSCTIDDINNHALTFSSISSRIIQTNGVQLPRINFEGTAGIWTLQDKLNCDRLSFYSGTLNTNNEDIQAGNWISLGTDAKTYTLGNSTIIVDNTFTLSLYTYSNVTVNPSTSLIECKELDANFTTLTLNNLKLTNTSTTLLNQGDLTLNKLILSGTGEVKTTDNLVVNDLFFEENGSTLAISGTSSQLVIIGGIESQASIANPAILKSTISGIQAEIDKPSGNLCATGNLSIQDIDAVLTGVFNAPSANDISNNSGINFSSGTTSGPVTLYWIAGSGDYSIASNYSKVSGGCPSGVDPTVAQSLIYDDNGIFSSAGTVTFSGSPVLQNMYFFNTSEPATLDVTGTLSVNDLSVDSGELNLSGNTLEVRGVTRVDRGFLSTEMSTYDTEELITTSSSLLIIRSGSSINVND